MGLKKEKAIKAQIQRELHAKELHRKAIARELHAKELKAKAKKRESKVKEARAKRIRNELTAKMNEMLKKHGHKEGTAKIKVKENKAKGIATEKRGVLQTIIGQLKHTTSKEKGAKHGQKRAEHVQVR